MASLDETIGVYLEVADRYEAQGHGPERDRFLLLAADAAVQAGRQEQADRLRRTLLSKNPGHMVRTYPTLAEAFKSADIASYIQQLRRTFPLEKAQQILQNMPAAPAASPTRGTPAMAERPSPSNPQPTAPVPAPNIFSFQAKQARRRPAPPALRPRPKVAYVEPRYGGSWVGGILFLLLLAASIALFVKVFVMPFVQEAK